MQNLFRCVVIAFGLLFGVESVNVCALFKKEMVDAEALTTKQKQCIDGLNNFQKSLSELQSKMKSIQAAMVKAEKKHKITEDTSFWMIFRYIISTLEYECDYLVRFTKEMYENISKYEKQAKKGKGVEELVVTNIQMALENFSCLGHRTNIACFRGVFAVMLQYILQIRECPEEEQTALEPIISEKHLAILSKNKDLYALLGSIIAKIPSFFNSLVGVSQIVEGEGEDSEEGDSGTKFKFITDGLSLVLLSLQDAVIYVRGGGLTEKTETDINTHLQGLTADIVENAQQMGVHNLQDINDQNNNQTIAAEVTDQKESLPQMVGNGNTVSSKSDHQNEKIDDASTNRLQNAILSQAVISENSPQQVSVGENIPHEAVASKDNSQHVIKNSSQQGESKSTVNEKPTNVSNSRNSSSIAAAAMKAAKAALGKTSNISQPTVSQSKNEEYEAESEDEEVEEEESGGEDEEEEEGEGEEEEEES